MLEIRPLTTIDLEAFAHVVTGYTSTHKYQVVCTESDQASRISLELVALDAPFTKHFAPPDDNLLAHYGTVCTQDYSFAAYAGSTCVGIALVEPHAWNRTLWVWELHVANSRRGQGIGRRLVDILAETGRKAGMRSLVCETQNTNVSAIRFYRSVGFRLEGIDLSYYSNQDYPDGEIAIFMKRRLDD